ncbi:MAG: hypothetical protein Mars2KO_11920 [Maribacter sp.]
MKSSNLIYAITLLFVFMSCSDDDISADELGNEAENDEQAMDDEGNDEDDMSTDLLAFQELYDQGADRYLGAFSPTSSEEVSPGVIEHVFTDVDGPICFTGEQFSMFTRDGSSDNLMIFLQGGGFCTPVVCEATETGIPLIPFGILNPDDLQNPTANYDVGYLPYCDGSQMMGDNEVDSDNDGVNDRFFRGAQNLSASLDVIFQTYPNPENIVLAGNSAGGFAVHNALPLVRRLYPDVNIFLINDSGNGIANPDGLEFLINYWGASSFLPVSCEDCIGEDGNMTGYHKYQLDKDENIRMAYISSKQDSVLSAAFSGGGPAFEAELLEAVEELKQAHPERFNGLIDNGEAHTYIIRQFDTEVGVVSVRQRVADMLNGNTEWTTVIE